MKSVSQIAALLALLCAFVGCDSSPYQLAPVSGKVTFDGKPLAGGVVNFQPRATEDSKTVGPGCTVNCDSEGRFVLKTIDGDDGAVVGTHTVRIYSFSPETAGDSDTDSGRVEKIPLKYNYRSTLTFDVPAEGTDAANFDLTAK
ncbi:MAG: hypothetical protein AAF497_00765 [Planctomycetota bacterium]